MQIIETENLTKYYGKTPVVDSLSLSVPEGSVYGFIGPNGAGKSTTINILCGQLKKDGGTVEICGANLDKEPDTVKRSLGEFERELDGNFYRAGRGMILNLRQIRRVTRTEVHLADGTALPLPRGAYEPLNRAIIART